MRDIEFRGKLKDCEGWVFGSLFNYQDCTTDRVVYKIIPFDSHYYPEVIPETVSQYTGLKDKNGAKIFEGDVLTTDNDKIPFEVRWIAEDGRYLCISPYSYNIKKEMFTLGQGNFLSYLTDTRGFEVIGNIHDNPELLEANHG